MACVSASRSAFLPIEQKVCLPRSQQPLPFSSQSTTVELPDFTDTEKAYKYKSTSELRRTYWVFWLFKYDILVDKSLQVP